MQVAPTLAIIVLVMAGCDDAPPAHQSPPRPDPPSIVVSQDPEPPDPAPGAVVVRTRRASSDPITVECRKGERLIGGGCKSGWGMEGHPVGYSATDTLGAGWICDAKGSISGADLTAYALCQGVPAIPAP